MADFWSKGLRGDAKPTPRSRGGPPVATSSISLKQMASEDSFSGQKTRPPVPGRTPPSRPRALQMDANSPNNESSPRTENGDDGDDMNGEPLSNDSVQVLVRVRPPSSQEEAVSTHALCVEVRGTRSLVLDLQARAPQDFSFDQVLGPETTQTEMFEVAGQGMVDNVLMGVNSSMFAYGQTGSGKTFTMIGNLNDPEKRGLAPRTFEYLYDRITQEEAQGGGGLGVVKYNCRCSFLEIYNEQITDLLNSSAGSKLDIREDPDRGPYVEGLTEPNVLNAEEMLRHLQRGAEARHTGETRLNRESSRSHSVFVVSLEKTVTLGGVSKLFYARINMIDLAGSERISSGAHGGSQVAGVHLQEACAINKSLTALGRVTTELLKAQKAGGHGHVPYRDSKLTFLLQSSLGGNAKTLIIANVSPSSVCGQETLSTLRFARQTKFIRNDAKVNWTVQGDRVAMQREIERLRNELAAVRSGVTDPLVQENAELMSKLTEERTVRDKLEQELNEASNAAKQYKRQCDRIERKLTEAREGNANLGDLVSSLQVAVQDARRAERAASQGRADEVATLEALLTASEAATAEGQQQCSTLQGRLAGKEKELEGASVQLAAATAEGDALRAQVQVLTDSLAGAKQHEAQLDSDLSAARSETATLSSELAAMRERASADSSQLSEQVAESQAAVERERSKGAALQAELQELAGQRESAAAQAAESSAALEAERASGAAALSAMRDQLSELQIKLNATETSMSEATAARDMLTAMVNDQAAALAVEKENRAAKESEYEAELEELRGIEQALREEKAGLLAHIGQQGADASDLATQLAGKSAEAETLRSGLTASQQHSASLESQLAAAQEQAAGLCSQLEASTEEGLATLGKLQAAQEAGSRAEARAVQLAAQLEQEERAHGEARDREGALSTELSALKVEMSRAASAASHDASAAQAAFSTLQAEKTKVERELAETKAELAAQLARLNAALDDKSKALAVKTAAYETLSHEAAGLRSDLSAERDTRSAAEERVERLGRELAEAKRRAADNERHAEQRFEVASARVKELEVEVGGLRGKLNNLDRSMAGQEMTTARQKRAMQEMKRLIDWAISPPGSARSSQVISKSGAESISVSASGMTPQATGGQPMHSPSASVSTAHPGGTTPGTGAAAVGARQREAGTPEGGFHALLGSLALTLKEAAADSPKGRYRGLPAGSPLASPAASTASKPRASTTPLSRHHGGSMLQEGSGDSGWAENADDVADTLSPGDQLPLPAMGVELH